MDGCEFVCGSSPDVHREAAPDVHRVATSSAPASHSSARTICRRLLHLHPIRQDQIFAVAWAVPLELNRNGFGTVFASSKSR